MVATKSIKDIAKKWGDVTPGRAPYYEAGVKAPGKDWEQETANAEDAYESGITEAISQNRFSKGVRKAGTQAWSQGSIEKGIPRYGPGVRASISKFEENFAPFNEELSRIALPARGARGDPRNIERVAKIADAMHKKRMELLG